MAKKEECNCDGILTYLGILCAMWIAVFYLFDLKVSLRWEHVNSDQVTLISAMEDAATKSIKMDALQQDNDYITDKK